MNGHSAFDPTSSWLLRLATQLLEPAEREVVVGDLAEARSSRLDALLQVLNLGIRRHAALWLDWRPWLAGPGLVLPGSFLLMGVSLSVSQAYLQLLGSASTPASSESLLAQAGLLLGWSWTGGFVVGRISRRTLWASVVLCCWPCLLCLSKFHLESLSPVCLLWFLIPATIGVRQGLRGNRLQFPVALAVALTLTLAMLLTWPAAGQRWWAPPPWLIDGVMSWPAWYLVFVSMNRHPEGESSC